MKKGNLYFVETNCGDDIYYINDCGSVYCYSYIGNEYNYSIENKEEFAKWVLPRIEDTSSWTELDMTAEEIEDCNIIYTCKYDYDNAVALNEENNNWND